MTYHFRPPTCASLLWETLLSPVTLAAAGPSSSAPPLTDGARTTTDVNFLNPATFPHTTKLLHHLLSAILNDPAKYICIQYLAVHIPLCSVFWEITGCQPMRIHAFLSSMLSESNVY
jgi:hypothetical protein